MVRALRVVWCLLFLAACAPPAQPVAVSRSVSLPVAPVALGAPESAVVNAACAGDCVMNGGPSVQTADLRFAWAHEDPPTVDYYEVVRAVQQPYFDPTGWPRFAMTTGQEVVAADSPPAWNPVGGYPDSNIMSEVVTFRVRACNTGGCSDYSNAIGVVSYSLMQGIPAMPH